MGFISNLKNYFEGVYFADYRHFVSDKIFINSLKHTFERIKSKPVSEKINSMLRFEMSEENLAPEDFANLEDSRGLSLLQYAASNLNSEAVRILLENGADVNHVSLKSPRKAHSPLMYALGNAGKIIYPTRDNFRDMMDYEDHIEEEARKALTDPKDFEEFKATVDLLIKHGGVAISPLSPIFTDKQADNKTGIELVSFAISFLDDNENCKFFKTDESGAQVPIEKSEMMEFLLGIDYFRENLSPELLSYAKQNDYMAFITLLDAVEDKTKMLNSVHKYESIEMAYYHNKELIASNDVRKVIAEITMKGMDPDNLPVCPEKFAYEGAMNKFAKFKDIHEKLSAGHKVLTEYDGPETFNFKPMPYYNHRYMGGEVVNLHSPNIITANAYLNIANGDQELALEDYLQDIVEVYPRILKHGNINHFAGLMEDEFYKIHEIEEIAEEEM